MNAVNEAVIRVSMITMRERWRVGSKRSHNSDNPDDCIIKVECCNLTIADKRSSFQRPR